MVLRPSRNQYNRSPTTIPIKKSPTYCTKSPKGPTAFSTTSTRPPAIFVPKSPVLSKSKKKPLLQMQMNTTHLPMMPSIELLGPVDHDDPFFPQATASPYYCNSRKPSSPGSGSSCSSSGIHSPMSRMPSSSSLPQALPYTSPPPFPSKTCRYSVRFNLSETLYYQDDIRNKSSRDCLIDTWYTDEEYNEIRSKARQAVTRLKQSFASRASSSSTSTKKKRRRRSEDSTENPNEHPAGERHKTSPLNVLCDLLDMTCKVDYVLHSVTRIVTSEVQERLDSLYQLEEERPWTMEPPPLEEEDDDDEDEESYHSESRCSSNYTTEEDSIVGLECFLQPDVKRIITARHEAMHEVVSDIQAELWSAAEMELELRDSCRTHSQGVALFAQLLAQAHYRASISAWISSNTLPSSPPVSPMFERRRRRQRRQHQQTQKRFDHQRNEYLGG